jgi:hypothetical protein
MRREAAHRMYLVRRVLILLTVAVLLCGAPLRASADDATVKTGILTCQVASGFGYIFGSSRTMECKYEPLSGSPERYMGSISKIGIDIGYLAPVVIAWAVVAPSTAPSAGALAGNYIGATAQAAVGVGGGVNVLTGGFEKSISLQPVSVEGDTGVYVGAGISSMTLKLENR